ncbi:unnamed protein product [Leptidea sinapis]|uniref:Uncharacterized protein n=1 Tax=Leptidea sinapis TaxID=189913 RepID=A0A5E4Q327_9NEOP|nr:unnamed protein product [Leptidea sinapis]
MGGGAGPVWLRMARHRKEWKMLRGGLCAIYENCIKALKSCLEIDVFIGRRETKFMRDIAFRAFTANYVLFIFDGLVWRERFGDLVRFQHRTDSKDFRQAYRIIFKMVRQLEMSHRTVLLIGSIVGSVGTLLGVQSVISFLKSKNVAAPADDTATTTAAPSKEPGAIPTMMKDAKDIAGKMFSMKWL